MPMYGDLVNLRAGAVDHREAIKCMLKCKGNFTPTATDFRFVADCNELKTNSFTFIIVFVTFHRN